MPSLMIPTKVRRDTILHRFFLFARPDTSVLFSSNGYKKHVHAGTGLAISVSATSWF